MSALIGYQAEIVPTGSGFWFCERTHTRDKAGGRRLVWSVRTYRDAPSEDPLIDARNQVYAVSFGRRSQ